jgi:hypothetical protein
MLRRYRLLGQVTHRGPLRVFLAIRFAVIAATARLSAAAALAACPQPVAAKIVVETHIPDIRHDFSKTSDQLAAISPNNPHARGGTLLGLTNYRAVVESTSTYIAGQMPDGSLCARIGSVTIRLAFDPLDVYVIDQLNDEPCLHEHVLTHEHHHVDIARETIAEYDGQMLSKVTDAAKRLGNIRARTENEAKAVFDAELQNTIERVFQVFGDTLAERQESFDSPAEYARSNVVCDGRLNAILPHK